MTQRTASFQKWQSSFVANVGLQSLISACELVEQGIELVKQAAVGTPERLSALDQLCKSVAAICQTRIAGEVNRRDIPQHLVDYCTVEVTELPSFILNKIGETQMPAVLSLITAQLYIKHGNQRQAVASLEDTIVVLTSFSLEDPVSEVLFAGARSEEAQRKILISAAELGFVVSAQDNFLSKFRAKWETTLCERLGKEQVERLITEVSRKYLKKPTEKLDESGSNSSAPAAVLTSSPSPVRTFSMWSDFSNRFLCKVQSLSKPYLLSFSAAILVVTVLLLWSKLRAIPRLPPKKLTLG